MAKLGHPLVGDPVYGRKPRARGALTEEQQAAVSSFPRQALHARKLRLVHPEGRRSVTYTAPLPADLAGLIDLMARAS
jgi:23S rRNA pseudouridine1911/1915/1917 synthase